MNLEERASKSLEQRGQDRIEEVQPESLSLNPESREVLEELKLELKNLQDRLSSPDTQKIPFTEQGGEQSIGRQMVALQRDKLPQIFKDTIFESSYLSTHDIQKEKYSCQLASVGNVLKALGLQVTEKEIAEAVGKNGEFANIWPGELIEYLKNKGLDVSEIGSALEAIEVLIAGGKIVLPLLPPKYSLPHTVVISGVKIENGEIGFYINDPYIRTMPKSFR